MNWLIWKEYRLNRLILIVGAVLLILPHVIALVLAWYGSGPRYHAGEGFQWVSNLMVASVYSIVASQLTLALLGGHAIAGERVDRSAEFLATLPLSRARILAGKITLAIVTATLIWGVNLSILSFATGEHVELVSTRVHERLLWGISRAIWYSAITGLVFFCVGWLLSSVLESPTFAICGGLVTPMLLVMALSSLAWLRYMPDDHFPAGTYRYERMISFWYTLVCLTLAPACFVAGTWYYLRRVDP